MVHFGFPRSKPADQRLSSQINEEWSRSKTIDHLIPRCLTLVPNEYLNRDNRVAQSFTEKSVNTMEPHILKTVANTTQKLLQKLIMLPPYGIKGYKQTQLSKIREKNIVNRSIGKSLETQLSQQQNFNSCLDIKTLKLKQNCYGI